MDGRSGTRRRRWLSTSMNIEQNITLSQSCVASNLILVSSGCDGVQGPGSVRSARCREHCSSAPSCQLCPTRAPAIITRPNDSYDNAPPAPGTFYRGRGRTQLKNMFPVAVFLSTFILIGRSRCSNNSKYSICMKYIVQ